MPKLYETETLNYQALIPVVKNIREHSPSVKNNNGASLVLVFSRHRHYRHLVIELYNAQSTKSGKLKNPLTLVDPLDLIWTCENTDEIKFYGAVSKFKNQYTDNNTESDLAALRAIVKNPSALPVYTHNEDKSANLSATSLVETSLSLVQSKFEITVEERHGIFSIAGSLVLGNSAFDLTRVALVHQYFLQSDKALYLLYQPSLLALINFFKKHQNNLVIERGDYLAFQEDILTPLEDKIRINYAYLKKATPKQVKEQGFDLQNEKIIYLSESEDFILITPVMRYGGLEIPVISRKQIKTKDKGGNFFTLPRDEEREFKFIADVVQTHPYFKEQVMEFSEQLHSDCFYMHRKHFLAPNWFLEAFENWRNKGIAILGFNQLKNNNFNAHKANISIKVNSGMDWFETAIRVKFNKQTVSLKHLHKSIRNKNKFVQLDDGTTGILPDEWLKKFESFFTHGEVVDEVIRTPNVNYQAVEELYEEEFLSAETQQRIVLYKEKLASFEAIQEVPVPKGLNAELRPYQREGLNWLNFLDGFNFGGCLADDMGLGKTIQVIAFILSQKERGIEIPNLVVVPASLVFNWQHEFLKFAPTLKIYTLYGDSRTDFAASFDQFDVVITSYGTMLSDIKMLKTYRFNYIFLDESQAIKNPDAQRYKAAKLLQARNRIVITGTPIENNTYDLYGQLSFACPGLLGNREYFRQTYSIPIDQFKLKARAEELQQRIKPFILRRTKEQVAKDLPEKSEMVIYCEMGERQREIYDSNRTEIRDYLMGVTEDELARSTMHVLQGITKLRQICNSPALISKEDFYLNASAKIDLLLEQIEEKAPYHKILVFSQFVGMLDLVKNELTNRSIKYTYLTGQTRNREAVVQSFQDDETVRVFLISLKAGGVGLNLTKADFVYLIDPWWNPAVENQAIDRTHRIGQTKNIMAVRLICPDTIEEKIMLMQDAKRSLAADLIKTDASIFKSLNKTDLLSLI